MPLLVGGFLFWLGCMGIIVLLTTDPLKGQSEEFSTGYLIATFAPLVAGIVLLVEADRLHRANP
jgi:hypothetical protein